MLFLLTKRYWCSAESLLRIALSLVTNPIVPEKKSSSTSEVLLLYGDLFRTIFR